tara:strand:- start:575 stop:1021 length:447 start_codon:yes stop_codon:yes gene_type:complete
MDYKMDYNTYASKGPVEKDAMVMRLLNKDKGTYKGTNYRAVVVTIDTILDTKSSEPSLIETAQRVVAEQRAKELAKTFDSRDAAQYVADMREAGDTEDKQLQAALMESSSLASVTRGGGRKTRRRKSRRNKTRKNKSRRNKTRKNKRR